MRKFLFLVCLLAALPRASFAQDNYEIQVYGSETQAPHTTMVEVHSNFTVDGEKSAPGSRFTADGTVPDHHAVHETLEVTQGFAPWFETGFYVFTSDNPGFGYRYVGSHIRPRVRAPESWHLPVGLGLSSEFGYVRPLYAKDTWTFELRPIVDKKIGRTYLAFNPALELSVHGPASGRGMEFAPAFKASYDLVKWKANGHEKTVAFGVEYYGACGPVTGFDPLREQQHQFFPNVDLDLSESWEFNFGVGVGATRASDRLMVKAIVGRRFSWGRAKAKDRD